MAGRANTALPYRRIRDTSLKAGEWVIDPETERERELPMNLPDWDYQMDLSLRRRVSLDRTVIARETGLAVDAPLALSVRWNAVPSLLRGSAAWVLVPPGQSEVSVTVTIPGERLGGRVEIETMIVLASSLDPRPGTAHRPGSSLWKDSFEVWLQGDAPLFPVAVIPFSRSGHPEESAWFVELGHDLHAPAMGATQLLLNSEHRAVMAALQHQNNPRDVDSAVLSVLRTDVVRGMLEHALNDEAFGMGDSYAKDTLGAVLQGLIRTFLPTYTHHDLAEIRRMRQTDPPMFAAVIQSCTRFLADRA
jgi:hypothetical protein